MKYLGEISNGLDHVTKDYVDAGLATYSQEVTAGFAVRPVALTADVTYYVDANNGSDDNDGLTAETALKTIMAAVNKIPKNLNGKTATVFVASGTYNENIILIGFHSGHQNSIQLRGNQQRSVIINGAVQIIGCAQFGLLWGLTINSSTGVYIRESNSVTVQNVTVNASNGTGISVTWGFAEILDCAVNNAGTAFSANGATAYITSPSGNSNTIGIKSGDNFSALMIIHGNESALQATTRYVKSASGIIFFNGSQVTA